ncbi:MAG: SMP-30/gluconolactonase/LRE family protein [Nitrospirae bacterium]|nr:SMP-30/gluconolactonase/LRE family protein [Nitrospirota bacterium]
MTDLATDLNAPAGIVLDSGGNVYFAEAGAGNIKTVPQAGGTVAVIAGNRTGPYDLLIDEGANFKVLYFVEFDPATGKVGKVCLSGCGSGLPGDVDSLVINQPGPVSLTQDGSNVYYVDREGRQVLQVSKNTSAPQTPIPLATSSDAAGPQDIVWVGTTLYFTDADTTGAGALRCVSTNGGVVTTIVDGLKQPGALETDGLDLYFTEVAPGTSTGTIKRVAANCLSNQSTTPLADSLGEPRGIAIDTNGDVYYTEWAAGRVGRVTGGVQTTLVSGLNHPFRLIIDGASIYFTETDTVF